MFWLMKKVFWISVLVVLGYFAANYKIEGKPIKDYVSSFYHSPLVQSLVKEGKALVQEFLAESFESKPGDKKDASIEHEQIGESEQKELENILEAEGVKP
jgi:hypothetical protein